MGIQFYNRNWRMANSWNGTEDNNTKFSNYSMSFDGAESINCGNDSSLNLTSTISLSAWVKPTTAITSQNFPMFIAKGVNSDYMLFANSGTGTARLRLGSSFLIDSVSTIATNVWTHIVGTYDGSNLKIYLNGSLDNTVSQSGAIPSTSGDLEIGSANNFNKFTGKLDHCSIFDYALSQTQVTQLYGSSSTGVGNPMAITNGRKPVAYYPLGDYSAYNGEYLVPNSAVSDYVFDFVSSSSQHINCGTDSTLNTSALTVSCWVKCDPFTPAVGPAIISKDAQGGTNRSFGFLFVFGSMLFQLFDSSGTDNQASVPQASNPINTDGQWHHLVATVDGTTNANGIKVYIDNVLVAQKTASATGIRTSTAPFFIGGSGSAGTSYNWNGEISNVSIFNTALPATGTESIESLYNYGTPPDISSYSGLQGFWKLDASATFDGSNFSIPDSSSNSNTGTSSGMTAANLVQSNLNILSPYSRYALDFDSASSDYIDCGNDSSLYPSTGDKTYSFWFKSNNLTSYRVLFGQGSANLNTLNKGDKAVFIATLGDELKIFVGFAGSDWAIDNGSGFNTSNANFVDNQWYHIAFTFDRDGDGVIYINGAPNVTQAVNSSSTSVDIVDTDNSLIGGSVYNFGGSLSNVSIWNAALTSAQVTELYNNGSPSNLNNHSAYSNLVSWWQLGENSSFNTNWTVLNEISTGPNGVSVNMSEDDLVNGVGTTANGLSSGMGGADNILGEAPYSTSNALSYGMGADAKSTSVPS